MELIEKELTYKGETRKLYFRELSGGEQVRLSQGTKATVREGVSELTLDYFAEGERGHKLLQMTLIDPTKEKPVYATLAKLQDLPASEVTAMVKVARAAAVEYAKRAAESGEE